jgi:group I intron endonuclease
MIYLITNKLNNKQYIGKTSQTLDKRWYQHCKNAEYGIDTYLYRAMRKHGVENFECVYLADGLDEEEILLIEQHAPEYNMTAGGDGGDTSNSPLYKEGMIKRRSYKGNNNPNYGKRGKDSPNYGKVRSEAQREKSRKGYKGKRIPVRIDGVQYESVSYAAKVLGRSEKYVRLHDEINEWEY